MAQRSDFSRRLAQSLGRSNTFSASGPTGMDRELEISEGRDVFDTVGLGPGGPRREEEASLANPLTATWGDPGFAPVAAATSAADRSSSGRTVTGTSPSTVPSDRPATGLRTDRPSVDLSARRYSKRGADRARLLPGSPMTGDPAVGFKEDDFKDKIKMALGGMRDGGFR